MQRHRDELVPIGEVVSGLDDVSAIRDDSPQARHSFTVADQVNQLVSASEDQRAYLNRMLRLALPFFRRRNILRENASSNARYPGLAGYAIHAAPARSIWISRSLLYTAP